MVVKVLTDGENGRKWEIVQLGENQYIYNYYEYYTDVGWRQIGKSSDIYSKEVIEFGVVV
jgi:hypothetical protein